MISSFEIGKSNVFVGGLHWQALSGSRSDYKKESQRLANLLQFDLAVWRTSSVLQVGYAATKDGYKAGMLSAAACVSKSIEMETGDRDFLCACRLPNDSWLYVAQNEGVIQPEGDFVGSEEEVRAKLLEDKAVGKDWALIIAPELWNVGAKTERDFEDFLPKKKARIDFKRWWALRPVKRSIGGVVRKLVPMAVIAAVVLGGMAAYQKRAERLAQEEAAARLAAAQGQGAPKQLPHPWKDQQRAPAVVGQCLAAFANVKTLWPGNWSPSSATCANGVLSIRWSRGEHGWIQHLLAVEPKATIAPDGASASLSVAIAGGAGEDEQVPDERRRSLFMHGVSQQLRVPLVLSPPQQPPPMPGTNADQAAAPVKDWQEIAWSVKGSQLSPSVVIAAMDGPGFRISNISARFNQGVIMWDMEGIQYVQP